MTHPSYDFTMGQPTVPQADNLYELVSERQGRSLIITSNWAPNDWISLFPDRVVTESLLSRLVNASRQVSRLGRHLFGNARHRSELGRGLPDGDRHGQVVQRRKGLRLHRRR
ncbi:ATP-binding protein [Streptomyces pseudovenezuelae]|uniref:ATP-binding protein n=1 Tax=Streptomyces pseudovenezuelae TaxID=67350 RepID=UPI002E305C37|nr:ATP-binding protein [Streptomyces pseudovenezuelae]